MIKNAEKNIKIYGLVIGIALFILLIAGLSYAYYQGKVEDTTTISGEVGMCFEVNYTKGGNVSGSDLLLLDKNEIINNNQITIRNGMVVTSISAGMDNTKCPDTYGYMNVYMKNTTLNNAFINGDSKGALKYVITSYDSNEYPTANVESLSGNSFNIVKEGTVTNTNNKLIFTDPMLPLGTLANYLVIFYLDGDLTFNDGGNTNFSTTISATASPSADNSAKSYISNLSTPTSTVVNNNITYNVNTINNIIADTKGNVRFYGANPDNYIYFNCEKYPDTNCETWRIIGVVDGKLKLMRGSSIGQYSWDTSASDVNSGQGISQWGETTYTTDGTTYTGADLMKLLNPGYENNQDLDENGDTIIVNNSLYYNSGNGICYSGISNATTTCNFTSMGIKNDVTQNKMAVATYYTGAWSTSAVYPNVILEKERGTSVLSNPSDGVTRTTTWTGRIAVPYASDYVYAADLSKCNKQLSAYNDSTCTSNNWMRKIITNSGSNGGWLLTHNSHPNRSFSVYSSGISHMAGEISNKSLIIPVLYLSENEVIMGGSGTESNPYRLEV